MTLIVLDASAALAWLLPSQVTSAATRLLRRSDDVVLVAPPIFEWEVLNILLTHARAGRLLEASFQAAVKEFASYPVELAEGSDPEGLLELARHEGLSLFDASYLALASALDGAVASKDGGLLAACIRCAVPVLDLRDLA